MGLFRKKKQKEDEEGIYENKQVTKAEYKIVLLEKLGGTVRVIKSFDAHRWIDLNDHVVYLRNSKLNFMEIFPQQINDFKNYTETEVNNLIEKYTNILQSERKHDTEDINEKDIEFELLKLKAKKRSFNFHPNASYLSFDTDSRATFYFLREGSTFFPFKWDTDTKTIFVPSDNRKKSASIALRNKETKYNTKKLLDGISIILLVVGFIMLASGGYLMYKGNNFYKDAFTTYDESEIAKAKRACLEDAGTISRVVTKNAEDMNRIIETYEERLNNPKSSIQGIIPE